MSESQEEEFNKKFEEFSTKIDTFNHNLESVNKKFDAFNKKFAEFDKNFDKIAQFITKEIAIATDELTKDFPNSDEIFKPFTQTDIQDLNTDFKGFDKDMEEISAQFSDESMAKFKQSFDINETILDITSRIANIDLNKGS